MRPEVKQIVFSASNANAIDNNLTITTTEGIEQKNGKLGFRISPFTTLE